MPIRLLINYSRSGGTLLSKCLASNSKNIVVSEVNPFLNESESIKEQLKANYNLEIDQGDYFSEVQQAATLAKEKDLNLIIRDWTFINFTPHQLNNFSPSYQLENLNLLQKHFDVKSIIFVRDAIDVWISRYTPKLFFEAYNKYVKSISNTNLPIFKYEDFCKQPEFLYSNICEQLSIKTNLDFKSKFTEQSISGDDEKHKFSRGISLNEIKVLKRKKIAKRLIKNLNANEDIVSCNSMLNYKTNYFSTELENSPSNFSIEIKHFIKQLINRKDKETY